MDRVVGHTVPALMRRRIVAAWAALERAEALLPPDHPAVGPISAALALLEADWRARQSAPAATATRTHAVVLSARRAPQAWGAGKTATGRSVAGGRKT